MTPQDEGYLEVQLSLFGSDVFRFRLAVDDFKTKWAILGVGISAALFYLAVEAKGVFL